MSDQALAALNQGYEKLKAENESLKSITELAVKGLKYYTGKEHAEIVRRYYLAETQFEGLGQRANVVLSEIERLQNEPIS